MNPPTQNQQLLSAGGTAVVEEEQNGEQDSLMPSDESSDTHSLCQATSHSLYPLEDEEEHVREDYDSSKDYQSYRDVYPVCNHSGGNHNANRHEDPDQLHQKQDLKSVRSHWNSRQQAHAWSRDSY